MSDVAGWRALIDEYGVLVRGEGHTPQRRGQRLNGMIAELFRCWGIEAYADVRSKGEIDVGFVLDGVRFVLEAKWEKGKSDTGQIAKLQKRVRQRLAGTYGVFLAMAGYTAEALADVGDGERLEVLLLDQSHWEAMLSGVVPPHELISLARDHAAFRGEAFAPIPTLFASREQPVRVDFAENTEAEPFVETAVDGCSASRVISGIESEQLGITSCGPDTLLLTTAAGILRADLKAQTAATAVPIPHCHRNALCLDDGSVMFTRRHGVAKFRDGEFTSVAGGAIGNSCLAWHPDGSVWLFDNGDPTGATPPSISNIGTRLGEQVRHDLAHPPATATNAAWVSPDRLIIIGNSGVRLTTLQGDEQPVRSSPLSNPTGLTRLDDTRVLMAGDGVTVAVMDERSGASSELIRIPLRGSVTELARACTGEIYLAAYDRSTRPNSWAVARLELTLPASLRSPVVPSTSRPASPDTANGQLPTTALREEAGPTPSKTGQDAPQPPTPFESAIAMLTAERREERDRGYVDGVRFAPQLGWRTLDSLAKRDFDLKQWLDSWRNGWVDIQMGRAPAGSIVAAWLPALADLLGSHVDPFGYDQWSFTPSSAYLDGFTDGLRSVWHGAAPASPGRLSHSSDGTKSSTVSEDDPATVWNDGPSNQGNDPRIAAQREDTRLPPGHGPAPASMVQTSAATDFIAVKGILGSIIFDGQTVTIRKEGYGPSMKGIKALRVSDIERVLVKPATAMFHGFIQFVVRDHPPAPDRRFNSASGRPHREDPESMSYSRRANREIEDLRERIEAAIAESKRT